MLSSQSCFILTPIQNPPDCCSEKSRLKLLSDPKYVALNEATWSIFDSYQHQVAASHWRPAFHISPVAGLLNDPNGFCFSHGEYHLFYQWYPFGVEHGMKHWAHVRSDDLVNWSSPALAMAPDNDYDARGVYSGTAFSLGEGKETLLYFTGNLKYENDVRDATQCVATLTRDGNVFKSSTNPLIPSVPEGYSGHVRDPKVFSYGDEYRMLLGAQTFSGEGCILVYRSLDALDWSLMGQLSVHFEGGDKVIGGYMWECPDYFPLDGKDVLLFSPQGVEPDDERFHNQFNVVYCIGRADWDALTFRVDVMDELDRGFDFYAPQSMENHPDCDRVFIAWAGCGDPDYPSDEEGWSNCMTFPRRLQLKDGFLHQFPINSIECLYAEQETFDGKACSYAVLARDIAHQYHLSMVLDHIVSPVSLALMVSEEERLTLCIDPVAHRIMLDRSEMTHRFAQQWGETREVHYSPKGRLTLDVLVDGSIVECFLDGGRIAMTARAFPVSAQSQIILSSAEPLDYQGVIRRVNASVNTAPISAEALPK